MAFSETKARGFFERTMPICVARGWVEQHPDGRFTLTDLGEKEATQYMQHPARAKKWAAFYAEVADHEKDIVATMALCEMVAPQVKNTKRRKAKRL